MVDAQKALKICTRPRPRPSPRTCPLEAEGSLYRSGVLVGTASSSPVVRTERRRVSSRGRGRSLGLLIAMWPSTKSELLIPSLTLSCVSFFFLCCKSYGKVILWYVLLLLLGLRTARAEGGLPEEVQGAGPEGGECGGAGDLPQRHARSASGGLADRPFQGDERLERVGGSGRSLRPFLSLTS